MPTLPLRPELDLGELALTTTLYSIYWSARGTDRALGAVQVLMAPISRGRPGRGSRFRSARSA